MIAALAALFLAITGTPSFIACHKTYRCKNIKKRIRKPLKTL